MSVEPGAPASTQDLLVPRSKPTRMIFDFTDAGAFSRDGVRRLIGCGGLDPKGGGVATDDFSSDAVGMMSYGLEGRRALKRTEKLSGSPVRTWASLTTFLGQHLVDEVGNARQHRARVRWGWNG